MLAVFRRSIAIAAVLGWAVAASAQSASPLRPVSTTYRVFLTTGEPLPSYGEPVFVDGRVIFNLLVDPMGNASSLQLVSLPLAGVDEERTARYTEAMRAEHYGATRGEGDYLGLTAEVSRVLDYLTTVSDRRARLALAERARRQLASWPADHYQYRVDDIRALVALFDGVISELRAAIGEPGVALDFVAGRPPLEPLLTAPSLREAVALALRAAGLADNSFERVAILRRASDAARRLDDTAVQRTVDEALADEERAGVLYAALLSALRARADRAVQRGDVAALEAMLRELDEQDARLGRRRPADVGEFRASLLASVATTRAHRDVLERYDAEIGARRRHAARLRPLLSRVDRVTLGLSTLRDMRGIPSTQLATLESTLAGVLRDLDRLDAPAALADVHALFRNSLLFAQQAAVRRRHARSSQADEMRESSAAAAGALLLLKQVRDDLEVSLRRPSIQ